MDNVGFFPGVKAAVPRSRKRGSIRALAHTPSGLNAELVKHKVKFTIEDLGDVGSCKSHTAAHPKRRHS
jgi:hypothetical protein